jgi:hypothetical protein
MIRLGNEDVREEAVIRPGFRYAILKVNQRHNDRSQGRMELDPARGPVRVSRREGSKISAGDTSTFHKIEDVHVALSLRALLLRRSLPR